MRIILSRKGFDTTAGGCPSPIVAGRPLSLPIPTRMPTRLRYGDLAGGVGEIVEQLTRGRHARRSFCHLDPDLDASTLPRAAGWRGALGQAAAAQGHLRNRAVGPGDLFLFFGLFRPASFAGHWRFEGAPEHRIFGWLQVDCVLEVGTDARASRKRFPWLTDHPHLQSGWPASNTVYVAREALKLGGEELACAGWGLFARGLRLTAPDAKQLSRWAVPDWLNPKRGGCGLTYHPSERFSADGHLHAAARGQEFVADIGEREDAREWVRGLFAEVLAAPV